MDIIHAMKTLPRLVERALAERLRVMPAVVVTGARQAGKSTLAAERVPGARRYATLDDLDVLDAARRARRANWTASRNARGLRSAMRSRREPVPEVRGGLAASCEASRH
jgi:hypothetical protein